MKISVDKDLITKNFLNPVSRISEECSIYIKDTYMHTLVSDLAGTVILYCKLNTNTKLEKGEQIDIHLKDIRKLSRVFDCIKHPVIDIDIDTNASVMKYKSPEISFKLHLFTENVIRRPEISFDKIAKLDFDSEFILTGERLSEILKGSAFAAETNKIYFFTKEGAVYSELTDKSADSTDSITFQTAEQYTGNDINKPLPFSLEILRLLNASRTDSIFVRINNTYKVLTFDIITPESETKYVVPAFTK